jgi:RNA polymerase sigma factor (sigma-70 family)
LRRAGNVHQAEEITQAVFVILATKAGRLRRGVILEGWLYQTARLTTVTHIRSEIRRAHREQKAFMQTTSNENEADAWSQMAPLLDGALADLNERDRNAVVLRFFYGKSLREIGVALGASEDSARMRVQRALEKLRQYFFKRGVTSTTAIIAGVITANSVQAAPMALAKMATAAALAKGAVGSASTLAMAKGALKIMAWSKTTIVGAVIVGLAAYSVMEHQARVRLREQNEALQRQMADVRKENDQLAASSSRATARLQGLQLANTSAALPATNSSTTNLYTRFKGGVEWLTPQQLDAFLQANGRSASTLLAAYRTGKDMALLREALAKYPNDPHVTFEAVTCPWLSDDEKRPWLKAFEQAAPDNALAYYLSAVDDFKTGRTDDAIHELSSVAGKHFDDYTQTREQDNVDAFIAAGYSSAEAQTASSTSLLIPQVTSMKQLGLQLVDLANNYSQAGDSASAQAVLQMALNLGQTLEGSGATSCTMTGFAVEKMALEKMNPNAAIGGNGQTVQDELNRIAQTGQTFRDLRSATELLLPTLTNEEMVNYINREALFGGTAAMQWVVNKYGKPQ